MPSSLASDTQRMQLLPQRWTERLTAALLILYCVAQVATIVTRIASGTDQPDAANSLAMLSANHSWYVASKIANLIAAFLLLGLSVLLYRVFATFDETLAGLASVFLVAAGILWLFSSLAGLALAETVPGDQGASATYTYPSRAPGQTAPYAFPAIEPVRALAGRVGFTSVALALMLLSTLIVIARPLPRWIGWVGWPVSLAMFFIWDPEATAMHRLGGIALLVWLLLAAALLAWKGTTRPALADDH